MYRMLEAHPKSLAKGSPALDTKGHQVDFGEVNDFHLDGFEDAHLGMQRHQGLD